MEKINEIFKSKTKSVRIKLFFMMTLALMLIVMFFMLANTFMIEAYYLYTKKDKLLQTYETINRYISSSNINQSQLELELEKIAINNNFNIIITDQNNMSIYTSNKD